MNIIGQKKGRLTILRIHGKDMHNHRKLLLCKCDCGHEVIVRWDHFKSGATKSCGCFNSLSNHGKWKGFGEIGSHVIGHYKTSARRRHLPFKVSIKYLWKLYMNQNKRCALTNEEIYFGTKGSQYRPTGGNASLDRIDNMKGYVKNNVQWVTKDVNMCRRTLSIDSFISLCEKVAINKKIYAEENQR